MKNDSVAPAISNCQVMIAKQSIEGHPEDSHGSFSSSPSPHAHHAWNITIQILSYDPLGNLGPGIIPWLGKPKH